MKYLARLVFAFGLVGTLCSVLARLAIRVGLASVAVDAEFSFGVPTGLSHEEDHSQGDSHE